MKIAVNLIDDALSAELKKTVEFVDIKDNPRGAYLAWTGQGNKEAFDRQSKIVDYCVKHKKPLIIFDRYQEIPDEMVGYLVTSGALLWEPAVNGRLFFSYQPCWGKVPRGVDDTPYFGDRGVYDLGYVEPLTGKIPTFEKYFKPVKDMGRHRVICRTSENRILDDTVLKMGIEVWNGAFGVNDIKATILLGTKEHYKTGYLEPNIFQYLDAGVVPMLPEEHRWYHGVFDNLVVRSVDDVEYILSSLSLTHFGLIHGVYEGIRNHLPECDVVNVASRVTQYMK